MCRPYVRVCQLAYAGDCCWLAQTFVYAILSFPSLFTLSTWVWRGRRVAMTASAAAAAATVCVCKIVCACVRVRTFKLARVYHPVQINTTRKRWCRQFYRNAYIEAPLDPPGVVYHDRTKPRATNIRINLICFSTSNFPYLTHKKTEKKLKVIFGI